MEEGVFIYMPRRKMVGVACFIVLLLLAVNLYLLTMSLSIWLLISLFVLFGIFVFLFMPLLKNQKVMLSGRKLILFTFGKKNSLDITKDLEEIVVHEDEVISYRFEKDGKYFQLSPSSYYEGEELKENLESTLKRYNLIVSVVSK